MLNIAPMGFSEMLQAAARGAPQHTSLGSSEANDSNDSDAPKTLTAAQRAQVSANFTPKSIVAFAMLYIIKPTVEARLSRSSSVPCTFSNELSAGRSLCRLAGLVLSFPIPFSDRLTFASSDLLVGLAP